MPVARLDSRALVSVTGPDAHSFLHGLLTQDVETLESGGLRYAALLGAQGRLLFDLFLYGVNNGVLIDVASNRRTDLVQRLSLYRLRANVRIALEESSIYAAWDQTEEDWSADPRRPQIGRRRIGQDDATASESDWRAHCLDQGVPDAIDFAFDVDYPIECNLDLLNGIDFKKGCFIGQEVASRMKRRGKVKSRLVPLAFDGPPPPFGAEILNGDLRAGEMRGGVQDRGMALLRLDRMSGELRVGGRPARPLPPRWLDLNG